MSDIFYAVGYVAEEVVYRVSTAMRVLATGEV